MMDAGRHPNIELLTYSELTELTGRAGSFSARIRRKPRFVDPDQCTACGDCAAECPVVRHSDFNVGLGARKAIYQEFPQAVPSAYVLSEEDCLRRVPIACAKCINACKIGCISHDDPGEMLERKIGSVILATGIDYYDPREASEYGYTRFKNVVTSFELERILSAGGPTKGELVSFTQTETPRKIAFINCVGSRNEKWDIRYCSRICCMNAIKDALLIREHYPNAEITIFYIDIRAFGKGFEEFYQRAVEEGVRFIKGKPSRITEDIQTGAPVLFVEDAETGTVQKISVDLAVLSAALIPPEDLGELSQILNIELDRNGFFKARDSAAAPLNSSRNGIYLCGCSTAPKDITDSIAEASGAAAKAALHIQPLATFLNTETDSVAESEKKENDPQPDQRLEKDVRTGVFVCHCGLNIGGIVDISDVTAYAGKLPGVVFADDSLFSCSGSAQKEIEERIRENRLNRVVVAACTPRTHEPVFRETLLAAGLNPYLLEMANIRDHCSWVHQNEPDEATAKAKDLVRMAVARAGRLEPLTPREMTLNRQVVVIGGGIAGMQAAVDIAAQGFRTTLIETQSKLGGRVRKLNSVYPSGIPGKTLISRLEKQLTRKSVKCKTDTKVTDISGFVGNFTLHLSSGKNGQSASDVIQAGAIVIAIGSDLYRPDKEFGYDRFSNVITSMDLEQISAAKGILKVAGSPVKNAAFIQCVGSRNPENNTGCSRYCCQSALKQALILRERGVNVTIFHRDIRVYTMGAEDMYRQAREMGVLFLRYHPVQPPKVRGNRHAESILFHHTGLNQDIEVPIDAVILSAGMRPSREGHAMMRDLLKIPRSMDGFFMERHPKFGPVETTTEGVFLTGCAQFPKDIGDSVAQSAAVAGKVAALLTRGRITMEPVTSFIISEFCRACGSCVEICEFNAIELTGTGPDRTAAVNEALCKGCGTCAAICPSGAIDIRHFRDSHIETVLEALFEDESWSVTS